MPSDDSVPGVSRPLGTACAFVLGLEGVEELGVVALSVLIRVQPWQILLAQRFVFTVRPFLACVGLAGFTPFTQPEVLFADP